MSFSWLAFPLLGIFGGFIAGLFGAGGGLMLVPILFMMFAAQGIAEAHLMHLALGTSMATMVFRASISSMRAHHGHGAVRWDIVKSMAPGLMLGTLTGTFIASSIPTRPLAIMYTIIVYYAALQMVSASRRPPRTGCPAAPACSSRAR